MRLPTARIRELRRHPTKAEEAAWKLLRDGRLGAKFRRQFPSENVVLDFYCFEHRVAIELDGSAHSQPDQMRKDAFKEDLLRTLRIRLLRIPNGMVLEHPEEFLAKVIETIQQKRPGKQKYPLTPTTSRTWGPLRFAVPPLPSGEGICLWRERSREGVCGGAAANDAFPSPRGEGG